MSRELWADGQGRAALRDGPARPPRPGHVLVQVAFSAVSWGTEVHMLRAGFRGRLGYQASGYVIGTAGPDGTLVRAPAALEDGATSPPLAKDGDLRSRSVSDGPDALSGLPSGQAVTVYGAPYVGHGERLWVPPHLLAPIADPALLPAAAYCGLGAIALHGLRLAGPGLGETALVAGLGMVGQWTVRLLRAAGVRTVALDPSDLRQTLAVAGGADFAFADPKDPSLQACARALGRPDGRFDAVLLCMGTDDPETLDRYIPLCAPGSTLVTVGDVPIAATREPLFQSEVRIVVSHAAGPGRNDHSYEAEGVDYPLAYVRWTEGRNLRAVADLLSNGQVDLQGLIGDVLTPSALIEAYAAGHPPDAAGTVVTWPDPEGPLPIGQPG